MTSWLSNHVFTIAGVVAGVVAIRLLYGWVVRKDAHRTARTHANVFCNRCGWKGDVPRTKMVCGKCGTTSVTVHAS